MKRLSEDKIHPQALTTINSFHAQTVDEVAAAVASHKVVVVGMGQNPFVGKVRTLLKENNVEFTYLEYGNYWSKWKPRLAIKLWSGWPTFPQVFVNGQLIGGFTDTKKLLSDGNLK